MGKKIKFHSSSWHMASKSTCSEEYKGRLVGLKVWEVLKIQTLAVTGKLISVSTQKNCEIIHTVLICIDLICNQID